MITEKDVQNSLETLNKVDLTEAVIDKCASMILDSAATAATEILNRRRELDRNGRKNETLIVIAGETHTFPAHHLHHLTVVNRLKQQEPRIAISEELPHDMLKKALDKSGYLKFGTPSLTKTFNAAAADKEQTLYDFSYNNYSYSPYARNLFLHNCLKNGIRIKYADTSRKQIKFRSYLKNRDHITLRDIIEKSPGLDAADPSTRHSMEACLGRSDIDISATSSAGMWIRNHHIVKKTQDLITESKTKPRIVFLPCGANHVIGRDNIPPKHSLADMFKKAGSPVLAYFLHGQNHYHASLVPKSELTGEDTAFIPALPGAMVNYYESKWMKFLRFFGRGGPKPILDTRDKEIAFSNALLAKMDMPEYGIPLERYSGLRSLYKRRMEHLCRTMVMNNMKNNTQDNRKNHDNRSSQIKSQRQNNAPRP